MGVIFRLIMGCFVVVLVGCVAEDGTNSTVLPTSTATQQSFLVQDACDESKQQGQWCAEITAVLKGNLLEGTIKPYGQPAYQGQIKLLGVGETTPEAKDYLTTRLVGKLVWLNFDSKVTSTEHFALPAYVFDAAEELNLILIQKGYAKVMNDFILLDHEVEMRELEKLAKLQKRGGWGDGTWK